MRCLCSSCGLFFFMYFLERYLVSDFPVEVREADLSLFRYQSMSAIKQKSRALVETYPKEVSSWRVLHGLHTLMDYRILLGEEGLEELWGLYLQEGLKGVSVALGVCFNTAMSLVRRFGFNDARHSAFRMIYRRMLTCGKNVFEEETSLKWYLFGFTLGDGSIDVKWQKGWGWDKVEGAVGIGVYFHAALSLVLASKDVVFLKGMGSFFTSALLSGPVKGCYSLTVRDRGVCESLLYLGILPRKSYVPTQLPEIPDEFFSYFLLGLLDSDGWVTYTNEGRRLRLGWCGHVSYLRVVYVRLLLYGFQCYFSIRADGLGILTMYATDSLVRLCNLMYKDCPYFLPRKYERIKSVLSQYGFLY